MFTKITRINPLAIISLNEAKDQLNIIDFYDDDPLILSFISAASDMCERYTKTLYSRCTVSGQISAADQRARLPYSPIASITTVRREDDSDVDYAYNSYTELLCITDYTIPFTENLIITFVAGYEQEAIPPIVKQAAKIIVSDLYNNRDSQIMDKMTQTTFNALRLLN